MRKIIVIDDCWIATFYIQTYYLFIIPFPTHKITMKFIGSSCLSLSTNEKQAVFQEGNLLQIYHYTWQYDPEDEKFTCYRNSLYTTAAESPAFKLDGIILCKFLLFRQDIGFCYGFLLSLVYFILFVAKIHHFLSIC